MKLDASFLSEELVSAFGWNLFHILWQGFFVALFLGFTLHLVRHKSSQLRYLLACFSLALLVGLSVFNFTRRYENTDLGKNQSITGIESINHDVPTISTNNQHQGLKAEPLIANLKSKIQQVDQYFPLIVNIWLLGIILFMFKSIIGLIYAERLKKVKTMKISSKWAQRFECIEQNLKIRKSISYLESRLIHIPVVIGYLKPVVVIPAELLTGMPFEQIEAIIAHEIAHIKRNDYLLNVLQTIIETVFFFHPAIWYISSQIRKERENCCDDMALAVCKGSVVYAKALVSVHELSLKKHYAAVAFSDNKKHLLNRIKRMIMKPKQNTQNGRFKTNITDKIIAAAIIAAGIFALSFTYSAKSYEYDRSMLTENLKPTSEALPAVIESNATLQKDTIRLQRNNEHIEIEDNTVIKTIYKDGKKSKMEFKIKNGKAYDLYVDGKAIPQKEYDQYQDEIDETLADLKEAKKDIRQAMKEIEHMNFEQIHQEVAEAMRDVHIDVEEIQREIARSMEDMDIDEITKNIEISMNKLEEMDFDFDYDIDIDMDEFRLEIKAAKKEMEKAREAIRENIDMESIEAELKRVQEELAHVDQEKIRMEIEKGLHEFEKHDKDELFKDLQEKLEELEHLELK